jgi:hypothetical protein
MSGLEIIAPIASVCVILSLFRAAKRMKKRRKEIKRLQVLLKEHGIHHGNFVMIEDQKFLKKIKPFNGYN